MKRLLRHIIVALLVLAVSGVVSACSRGVMYEDGDFDYTDDAQDDLQMLNSEIDADDQYHE